MLNIFTDTQFLTETHRKEVFPLLFDIWFIKSKKLSEYYKLVAHVETCDVVVLPINYSSLLKHNNALNNLLTQAKNNNKPIWVYTSGDYGLTNCIPNSYTFRLGGFESKLSNSSFIIPSFINDPYTSLKQEFNTLKKEEKPSIGFVGHAQSGVKKYWKECINHLKTNLKRVLKKTLADQQQFYPSSIKRAAYLKVLLKDKRLNTNFVLRHNYRAGSKTQASKVKTTHEFYSNMYNNAYTFCSRGVGNFSVRFYETLAMGRIPVLLNTDCRLPLQNKIHWKQHCVIIEEKDVGKMPELILSFHNSITEAAFLQIQKSNRELWENKLKRDQYFIAIYNNFSAKNQEHA